MRQTVLGSTICLLVFELLGVFNAGMKKGWKIGQPCIVVSS